MIKRFRVNNLVLLVFVLCGGFISTSHGYNYETRKANGHVIHIVTFLPQECDVDLVKAHNNVIGRETVASMAERSNGIVAINTGFFEIGSNRDGMPSGTLIINGKIHGLVFKNHPVLSLSPKEAPEIKSFEPKITLQLPKKTITISKVNQPSEGLEPVLFTSAWYTSTLTSFKNRREIAFNQSREVLGLYEHGNAPIPPDGYVVSLPQSFAVESTDKYGIKLVFEGSLIKNNLLSCVSGIPQILNQGSIPETIEWQTASFFKTRHARSAVGIKADGSIVLVQAEHAYGKDPKKITLDEIKFLLEKNASHISKKYKKSLGKVTIDELKGMVSDAYSVHGGAIGLTMLELAQLMKDLGCDTALNLDGGGSSTLWIGGKVVNQTFGDKDEGNGLMVARAVSDALVFRAKVK